MAGIPGLNKVRKNFPCTPEEVCNQIWINEQVTRADLIEPPVDTNKPDVAESSNLVVQGFRMALRHWPFVVWAYAINLCVGLLTALPWMSGLAPFLDHSLEAQKIAGTIDLSALGELAMHLYRTGLRPAAMHTAGWLSLFELAAMFFLFTGTVFAYVAGEPAQLLVLLRGGLAYFWRFVRASCLAGACSAVILGLLLAVRALLLAHAEATYVDRTLFLYAAVTGAVVLLVGLLLRLWWDLVEVYVVRNVLAGETRVRYAFMPALRLLHRHFFRVCGSFLLAGVSGVCALALCLYAWNRLVPAHQVWLAALLAQLGLFLLLASRFWQRGVETALVLAVDPVVVALADPVVAEAAAEESAVPEKIDAEVIAALPAVKEPTLRDLVLKLRTEPLAAPDLLPLPPDLGLNPMQSPVPPVDRHAGKFPLGGVEPTEAPQTDKAPSKDPNPKK